MCVFHSLITTVEMFKSVVMGNNTLINICFEEMFVSIAMFLLVSAVIFVSIVMYMFPRQCCILRTIHVPIQITCTIHVVFCII